MFFIPWLCTFPPAYQILYFSFSLLVKLCGIENVDNHDCTTGNDPTMQCDFKPSHTTKGSDFTVPSSPIAPSPGLQSVHDNEDNPHEAMSPFTDSLDNRDVQSAAFSTNKSADSYPAFNLARRNLPCYRCYRRGSTKIQLRCEILCEDRSCPGYYGQLFYIKRNLH